MRIGIDLGGTKTEGAVLDSSGAVVLRRRQPTPRARGYDAVLEGITQLISGLEAETGQRCPVGVGMPGIVDRRTGRTKNANTVCLNGRPLQQDLEARLARPVVVMNDANCFALAEARLGAGTDGRVVFGVILGTGVGGGLCFDGRVHAGRQQIAGEWGHSPVHLDAPQAASLGLSPDLETELIVPCYCGQVGCVETRLSGPALARDARRLGVEALEHDEDAASVFALDVAGDPAAQLAVARWLRYLAIAMARVIHIMDPDVIVLGGGLSNSPRLAERLAGELPAHLFNEGLETPIRRHQLGDSAGVIGAALLADPG